MPELKVAQLDESLDELQAIFQDFANRKGQFWKSLKNASILGSFRLWFKDHFDRPCLPEYASLLFEQDCLGFGNEIKIGEYNFKQVPNALGQVRCLMGPSIVESERLVELIVDFFTWLHEQSDQLTPKIDDPDLELVKNKIVSHDKFIRLLACLDDRCRIIAKLLYFGTARSVEEIVEIQIEDIQFRKCSISFQNHSETFPVHVIEDIRRLIRTRASGPVFLGRNNTLINSSTVFRNFKTVGSSLDLGEFFSPKTLASSKF